MIHAPERHLPADTSLSMKMGSSTSLLSHHQTATTTPLRFSGRDCYELTKSVKPLTTLLRTSRAVGAMQVMQTVMQTAIVTPTSSKLAPLPPLPRSCRLHSPQHLAIPSRPAQNVYPASRPGAHLHRHSQPFHAPSALRALQQRSSSRARAPLPYLLRRPSRGQLNLQSHGLDLPPCKPQIHQRQGSRLGAPASHLAHLQAQGVFVAAIPQR